MDIKLSIIQKVEQCFVLAEQHFNCVLTRPKVGFDIRGQDAGRAYFPSGKYFKRINVGIPKKTEIKFNEILLESNTDFFLKNIVAHECAHLIVYELFGTKALPHGKEWKTIMHNVFQADSLVRHNLDVVQVANKPFIYSCACEGEGIALSQRQHNRVKKGSVYLCKRCKAKLSFKLEKKVSENTNLHKINGLYLHINSEALIDTVLLEKINHVLGRKKPARIFSSINLSNNELYKNWLRSKNLVRKYQGCIVADDLDVLVDRQEISHALFVIVNDNFSDQPIFENLKGKGIILRSINIKLST